MAVTKQVYTLDATWTESGLANTFRSAFIDAGIMTEWYDSFLSGSIENRILEVVNDATKTYGTVYYWFMFTTTEVRVHTALSWDATSHVPTGTQYQNYFATTTNATTYHYGLITGLAATTSLTLTRYTSAINTSCTWFLLSQASARFHFLIPHGAYTATSFVNQDVFAFNPIVSFTTESGTYYSGIFFLHRGGHTRRTYLGSSWLRGTTSTSNYIASLAFNAYGVMGNYSGGGGNNVTSTWDVTWLPTAFSNTNTALTADYTPVYTSISISSYLPVMPADFALSGYYTSNAVLTGDTFIVSAGSEEYEVLSSKISNNAHMLFLVRTVG